MFSILAFRRTKQYSFILAVSCYWSVVIVSSYFYVLSLATGEISYLRYAGLGALPSLLPCNIKTDSFPICAEDNPNWNSEKASKRESAGKFGFNKMDKKAMYVLCNGLFIFSHIPTVTF